MEIFFNEADNLLFFVTYFVLSIYLTIPEKRGCGDVHRKFIVDVNILLHVCGFEFNFYKLFKRYRKFTIFLLRYKEQQIALYINVNQVNP